MLTCYLKGHKKEGNEGEGGGGKEDVRYFCNYKITAQETNSLIFMINK